MGALGNLIPLVILFVVVGGGGYMGYQMYLWSNEMTDRGKKHMEKKNMSFTKEGGLKVGVKEMKDEAYADKTQQTFVNVWNNASFPNYKSNLGWNGTQTEKKPGSGSSTPRPSGSRTNSNQSRPSSSRNTSSAAASGAKLTPSVSHSSQRRGASPVPGSW